nr:RluA family pseudouridine synthase [Legionella oakridgensis]
MMRIPPVRISQEKDPFVSAGVRQCLEKNIIYEDNQLLVINKPAGMAVHGGSGLSLGVIEVLRKTRPDLPYLELVHRLDKETSGCLLLAKKRSVLRAIQALLAARAIQKTYWALLMHPWKGKKKIQVDAALAKNVLKSGERMVMVSHEGKLSQTEFKLLENFLSACWVEAYPKTGRTHQIRVHSAYLGHPIVGDQKYGEDVSIVGFEREKLRLHLHARAIQFTLNDKCYFFQADLDERFTQTLAQLRLRSKKPNG